MKVIFLYDMDEEKVKLIDIDNAYLPSTCIQASLYLSGNAQLFPFKNKYEIKTLVPTPNHNTTY